MAKRHRLLVALLIGGSVATEIDGIRRALASSQLERIPPHVTLIPPTNVADDALASAEQVVRETAGRFEPVALTLGPPDTFPDNRSVLMLPVSGAAPLATLREVLLDGPFGQRGRAERSFVPHVTLDSRKEPFVDDRMLRDLGGYTIPVEVATLTLLAQGDADPLHAWTTLTSYDFARMAVVGRGGREVHLHAGRTLSPSTRALLASWDVEPPEPVGENATEWFALASVASEIIAVATWTVESDIVVLDRHIVAPTWRGLGIGTSLLSFVEGLERARSRQAIVVVSGPDDASEAYYRGRGYRRDLPLLRPDQSGLTRLL